MVWQYGISSVLKKAERNVLAVPTVDVLPKMVYAKENVPAAVQNPNNILLNDFVVKKFDAISFKGFIPTDGTDFFAF